MLPAISRLVVCTTNLPSDYTLSQPTGPQFQSSPHGNPKSSKKYFCSYTQFSATLKSHSVKFYESLYKWACKWTSVYQKIYAWWYWGKNSASMSFPYTVSLKEPCSNTKLQFEHVFVRATHYKVHLRKVKIFIMPEFISACTFWRWPAIQK